jgi:DNA-binding PadR family transcriptional regulator
LRSEPTALDATPFSWYIQVGYIHRGQELPMKDPPGSRDPQALVPLTPAIFHILLALADGESHGYGIMQEVEELTGGQVRLGPGTLYRSLQRMLVEGLIEELDERPGPEGDERRRYYRVTALGRRVAQAEAQRLAALVRAARARKLLPRRDEAE